MSVDASSVELWRLDAVTTHSLFKKGHTSPSEVLALIVERLHEVNPKINAFAALDVEGASQAAKASDARWQSGQPLSALDGVVMTIKDNMLVRDMPCRWGNEVFPNDVPDRDEVPVERLRAAGVIILGKTNVSEFSTGRGIVSTRLFGTTRNPWDLSRTPGSSSGGAVAAVSSGIGAAALGTDGGGSIRAPASHCGLVGLKPTQGRVARAHGLPVILGGREVVSPVARTTADLEAVFRIIARSHPLDASSWGFSDLHPSTLVRAPRQRILFFSAVGDFPVSEPVRRACAEAAENLQRLGHLVEEGPAPFDITIQQRSGAIGQAGLAWLLKDKDWQGRIDDFYKRQVEAGNAMTAIDYVDANNALRTVQGQIGTAFETYDLLLSPVTVLPAHEADVPAPAFYNIFTSYVNTAGIPAIAIPGTVSPEGLPIGFQLAGRFGADWNLIQVAKEYEESFSWIERRPPL